MNGGCDQTPTYGAVVTSPIWAVIWADRRGRQRCTMDRHHFETAALASINSRCRGDIAWPPNLIKDLSVVLAEILIVFIIRHFFFVSLRRTTIPNLCPKVPEATQNGRAEMNGRLSHLLGSESTSLIRNHLILPHRFLTRIH
jgi:hypothetical protein